MTPSPELSALMALDALGEATPEQQAELRLLLAAQPGLAAEHAALCDTALHVDTVAARDTAPLPVPAQIAERLEQARLSALSRAAAQQAGGAGAGNVVAFDAVSASQALAPSKRKSASASSARPRSVLTLLAWAAAIALLAVPLARWMIPSGQGTLATASPALAPRGETGMTQPTLVWDNAPDQKYDVWILPDGADQGSAAALFVATEVRSPVSFASLKPDPASGKSASSLQSGTRYLALVCLAGKGRMAGVTVPFQTAPAAIGAPPAPSDPAVALALARQSLAAGRPGDALMILAKLPDNVRHQSETTGLEAEIRRSLQTTKAP